MGIESAEAFQQRVAEIEAEPGYQSPVAFGIGLAHLGMTAPTRLDPKDDSGAILDTWYPTVNLQENLKTAAVLAHCVGHKAGSKSYRLNLELLDQALGFFAPLVNDGREHPNLAALQALRTRLQRSQEARRAYAAGTGSLLSARPVVPVVTFIDDLNTTPVDAHDAYLRLHLLSHRRVQPHGCSLEGVFGKLTNVVWTDQGPFAVDTFSSTKTALMAEGVQLKVQSIDKFPRMTDYVVPTGVRIGDADRVRLGAHLGEGTTVMHEGFVNFNAGTLGASMVEGRISAGVVVGEGSDVGGGASIMGTLSGGGKIIISLGKGCLLGANAGCGIPLGNNCVIEAGCYVTAGAKVTLPNGEVVKAATLAGKSDLLFLRNSQTGAIEARPRKSTTELNEELHKN